MRSLFWKIFLWFWLAMTFVIATTAVVSFSLRPPGDNAPLVARTTRWRFVANTSFTQWAHAQAAAWEKGALPQAQPENAVSDDIASWLLDDDDAPDSTPDDAEWWLFAPNGKALAHRNGSDATSKTQSREVRALAQKAALTDRVVASRPEILAVPNSENANAQLPESESQRDKTEAPTNEASILAPVRETLLATRTLTPRGQSVVFVARLPLPGASRPNPNSQSTARRAFPLAFFFLRGEPLTRTLRLLTMLLTTSLFCWWLARHVTRPVRQLRATVHQLSSGNLAARSGRGVTSRNDELGDLGRDFDAMASRLDTLMTAQRRLISDVSHELRSPLARLGIALELARRHADNRAQNSISSTRFDARSAVQTFVNNEPKLLVNEASQHADAAPNSGETGERKAETSLDAPLQTALNRIEREAARLEEMVAQLLMLSRLESGAALEHSETFDVLELLREAAADARFEAQTRYVAVEIAQNTAVSNAVAPNAVAPNAVAPNAVAPNADFSKGETCVLRGARSLLRSALENVLRNAIRFAPPATTVRIETEISHPEARRKNASPAQFSEKTSDNAPQIVIRVLDSGLGVPADALPKLFEPFYRVEDARDRQSGGTGLGLAIAARAVHLHGGTIRAFNRETGGLCIEISLPQNR